MLSFTARRERFREILARDSVTRPASIFDPVSARLAERNGFESGVLGGSVACHAVLGAPDLPVITLTELADQSRRISRASSISFFVDADNGYGNALNVIRTVEELEAAGVAAVTIEDANLPRPYGKSPEDVISVEEFEAKLKAAVAARLDTSFVVIGRTAAIGNGIEDVLRRIEACNRAGVEGIFLARGGRYSPDDLRAVAAATKLPLVGALANNDPALQAECNVKLAGWDHTEFSVIIKALNDTYEHIAAGRPSSELRERATSPELDRFALAKDEYASLTRRYLGAD